MAVPQLECHSDNSDGFEVWRDDKVGFIDSTGGLIAESKYDRAGVFSEGLAPVAMADGHQRLQWGFINLKGEQVIPMQFDWAREFSEGLAPVEVSGKSGFIDTHGVFKISPQFEDAFWFCEGLAAVRKGGRVGFIDKSGSFVIPPQFGEAGQFIDGVAAVMIGGKHYRFGWPLDLHSGKWGFVDKRGEWVIQPSFDSADKFAEGLAAVKVGSGEGYIDKTGTFVIAPQFHYAVDFSENLARVADDTFQWGAINKKGEYVIPLGLWAIAGDFSEGLAPVETDKGWGYIDNSGMLVIPPQFDWAFSFHNGLAKVCLRQHPVWDGHTNDGYINRQGTLILKPPQPKPWAVSQSSCAAP